MLLTALALIILSARLTGGRLRLLASLRPRWGLLLFGALAMQIAVFTAPVPRAATLWLNAATYLVGLAYLLANLAIPGIWLVALGAASNIAAIVANAGVMPA